MPRRRNVAIVGAGPTGLYLGMTLARRGDHVTVVERDAGPKADGTWTRKGVMQFLHPHFFRPQVREALVAELSDVAEALVEAGAILTPGMSAAVRPGWCGADEETDVLGYRVRRLVVERVLRDAAMAQPGLSFVVGNARDVAQEAGVAGGVVVDGSALEADLVIDASGRSGRFTEKLRAPAEGTDSGIAYASRQYELLPGAEPGPFNSAPGWHGIYDGYLASIFYQDARTFQVLIVRAATDRALARLREDPVFDAVANSIPGIHEWVRVDRSRPVLGAMSGAGLYDTFRHQLAEDGRLALPGVVWVGDAVLTTNPILGRGFTTSVQQAQQLLALLDEHGTDYEAVTLAFDAWCTENMQPWALDHIERDLALLARWRGEPIDLTKRLPSDLICAVAEVEPSALPAIEAFLDMRAGPSVLDDVEPIAREAFRAGFRPKLSAGPTRDDLAELIDREFMAAAG